MLHRPSVRTWSSAAALVVLLVGSTLALAAPPPSDPMAPAAAAPAPAPAPVTVTAPPPVLAVPAPAPEPPRAAVGEALDPQVRSHRSGHRGRHPDFPFDKEETKRMVEGAIAIVVPVTLFLVIFLIVLAVQIISLRKERQKQETLRAMVEKGAAIPPELLSPPVVRRGSDLRKGLVLLLGGIGLALFLAVLDEPGKARGVWSLGLIPGLIGVGYLISWRVEQRSGRSPESK